MRKLKRIGLILLAILGLFILIIFIVIQTLKPSYSGTQEIAKLNTEVNVYYDTYGIPHIYGESKEDAFRSLGYVHAQDRLWQMELLRRIGRGGLSEVFGPDVVSTDKFFLSLGIDENSEMTVANLDVNAEVVQLSQAYLDGINQFIEVGPTPIEFYLTGIEKTPFTLKDMYNTLGYMSFSFAMAHKTDPLLTNIKDKLGVAYLEDLEINVDTNTVWIQNYKIPNPLDTLPNTITSMVSSALKGLAVPQFIGSNSWVIAPEKTKNGKVIFANDPHIGFSQPSVWYEAHVSAPNYEKYGYHLAGIPFPLLGHDRNLAYGLTMFENDDVDFYYEENHPTDNLKYKTAAGWENYTVVSKTIKVKDSTDVTFTYKKSVHGPILNGIADQVTGERPIAMSWIYTKVENKVMDAIYAMSHARNIDQFKKGLPNIHAPGLNVMYGDAQGNVAWWASAKLYQMPDSTHTKFILNGSSGKEEPLRYLNFSENPQAVNPPWNYVYSANNQPDSIAGMLYPGYYLSENRAKRIVTLLEAKDDWDGKAAREMITDVTSAVNPDIVVNLAKLIVVEDFTDEEIECLDKLNAWEGDYPIASLEAALFHKWLYLFLKNTFEDELGVVMFEQLMNTHLMKRAIASMAEKENSIWWDNVFTENEQETKQDIVNKSYKEAFAALREQLGDDMDDWEWGEVHSLEHEHPIGRVAALRKFFNVGPFPIEGSREVINNLGFTYTPSGEYQVKGGPSTRRIIDFSDIENSMSILPTGQSGNPFSKYYEDQAEMFVNGQFRKMMLNKTEITESAASVLTLKPKK
ncbi:penicillin acylase family protein [Spongiimicrobium salis]|uniref:penicillin acylase family protein n=1 Tax=Spongiimicrobium salis TaxID=1667022 RepID=UPI00374DAE1E